MEETRPTADAGAARDGAAEPPYDEMVTAAARSARIGSR